MRKIKYTLQRRLRKRSTPVSSPASWEWLNTFLTSFVAVATLAIAYAQWQLAREQTAVSAALARLDFAKSEARFEISPSRSLVGLGPAATPLSVGIPKTVTIKSLEGVRFLETIDGPVDMSVTDTTGEIVCDVEVRGLYIENERGTLSIMDPAFAEFKPFLAALRKRKLDVTFMSPVTLVRYRDLLGNDDEKRYGLGMELDGPQAGTAILYSGAWSNGHGFYFDDDEPERSCPKIARQLHEIVAETGGQPGNAP